MKYGIIGEKLPHSFSKEIHEMIGKYEYEKKEIAREDFDDFATKRDFLGINITIPYKRDIIPYLSYMSDGAKSIGAVNVAINKNGALYGYNTDFTGLMGLIKRAGFDFSGKTVLIFGAGGTSRTARAVSESLGASVIKFVKGSSCDMAISYEDVAREYKNADFIINTSPAGMYPHMEECPWDAAGLSFADFPNLSGVVDVVYNPLRTDFVNKALLSGIPAVGGLYMLVSQAVAAAELFVDESIDDSLTENIYKKLLADKENIVLTGMPGSGKSTIGKKISELLSRPFYDTDEEAEKEIGNIAEYIKNNGEAAFRAVEKRVIKELCEKVTGAVISTGGGAVLDTDNILRLRRNGRIYFIDRNIDLITPTSSRPLSRDRAALKKRFEERYDIYKSTSDVIIENNASFTDAAKKIAEDFPG